MKRRYEYACDVCDERSIVLESRGLVDFQQIASYALSFGWQRARTAYEDDILICPDCSEDVNPELVDFTGHNTSSSKKTSSRLGLASTISLLFVVSFSLIVLWSYDKTTNAVVLQEIAGPEYFPEVKDLKVLASLGETLTDDFHIEADETADVDPAIISKIEENPEAYSEKIEAIVLDEDPFVDIDRELVEIEKQLNQQLKSKTVSKPEPDFDNVKTAKVAAGSKGVDKQDNFTVLTSYIRGSLNQTLLDAKLTQKEALMLSNAFADSVNLNKDITPKDYVSLIFINENNRKNIKAAKLICKGKTYHAIKDDVTDNFKLSVNKSDKLLKLFANSTDITTKPEDAANNLPKPLVHGKYAYFTNEITSTFSTAAQNVGLGFSHVKRLMHIFSYSVNFKQFAKGDKFTVIFDNKDLSNNNAGAKILAAEFIVRGKKHQRIRYMDKNGKTAYYMLGSEGPTKTVYKTQGKGKGFLRYPLRYKRISSHFNLRRRHPISRKIRAHKGTDFAAPRGTPVKSTGDGVVSYAGWQRGYGRVVKIRHYNGKYETVYAHLSRLNKRAKKGKKVGRGQVIGYVGSTGASTGNHLHYEFRVKGRAVNPLRVKLPKAGKVIATKVKDPAEYKRFSRFASLMKSELAYCRKKNKLLASAQDK